MHPVHILHTTSSRPRNVAVSKVISRLCGSIGIVHCTLVPIAPQQLLIHSRSCQRSGKAVYSPCFHLPAAPLLSRAPCTAKRSWSLQGRQQARYSRFPWQVQQQQLPREVSTIPGGGTVLSVAEKAHSYLCEYSIQGSWLNSYAAPAVLRPQETSARAGPPKHGASWSGFSTMTARLGALISTPSSLGYPWQVR